MPITRRGHEILKALPGVRFQTGDGAGCEVIRLDLKCTGCGRCVEVCPGGAAVFASFFDVRLIFFAPEGTRRGLLGNALRRIARHEPEGAIEVPGRVKTYRNIVYTREKCLGCGACARVCPSSAIEKGAPGVDR
jgi:ferredoxin